MAATLVELGVDRALVVHGCGGLDEISLAGETQVAEVHDGTVRRLILKPEDFGLTPAPLDALQGSTPQENATMIRKLFEGQNGPRRDVVVMNSAAALVVTGIADNFQEAAAVASRALSSGKALAKLDQLRAFTNTGR